MAYQVLARKWRPRSFRAMAGQSHVLKTLINALDNNRLHHAYLFTGTRGVGKTTIARILAKCLNCEEGVSASPCGQCSACREIDEGRFIDLIEVDAASRTKVEDTRELLDNVQYAPTRGRYKVYLIDEVHMLSGHSFNALLKTLEEPPPHVKFLLATTDPQKLPITVLSRCLQFNLKNLSPEQLVEHLSFILKEEQVPFEEPALWQIARAAQGSVRDALTLLDQAIAYCEGHLRDEAVSSLLGTIDQSIIHHLVEALAQQNAAKLLQLVEQAASHAPDFAAVLEALLSFLHRIAIAQVLPDGVDNSQGDRAQVLALARSLPAENVHLYYQIGLKGREELPLATSPRAGVEMLLLRMLAFTPEGLPSGPLESLPAAEKPPEPDSMGLLPHDSGDTKTTSSAPAPEAAAPVKKPEPRPDPPAQAAPANSQRASGPEAASSASVSTSLPRAIDAEVSLPASVPAPVPAPPEASPSAAAQPAPASPATAQSPPASPAASSSPAVQPATAQPATATTSPDSEPQPLSWPEFGPGDWIALFPQLALSGITRNIASHCVVLSCEGEGITLGLHEGQASVFNEAHERRIRDALNQYFARELSLSLRLMPLGPEHGETPAAWRRRMKEERQRAAEQAFAQDPHVQTLVERFSAAIITDSITPLGEDSKP